MSRKNSSSTATRYSRSDKIARDGPSDCYADDLLKLGPDAAQWWVKIVGMLQQNWAIPLPTGSGARVLFVSDASGIFDHIDYGNQAEAGDALAWNGFNEYDGSPKLMEFFLPPRFPLNADPHPNGPIYSSGRYWNR